MAIERLMGPTHNVAYTQDHVRSKDKRLVSVVGEKELKELERFYTLPIHQQINIIKNEIRMHMRKADRVQKEYPRGTFMLGAIKALELAEDMTFAYFASLLEVTEVVE